VSAGLTDFLNKVLTPVFYAPRSRKLPRARQSRHASSLRDRPDRSIPPGAVWRGSGAHRRPWPGRAGDRARREAASFDAALAQLAAWQSAGVDISIAVNLSTRSLHDEKLPETMAILLRKWQVEPGRLTLELTESAVMLDPDGAQRNLYRLHDLGIRLSIDDFGTGYSSLSHLQRLPLHELKIDKSFVVHMIDNDNDLVIVRSTIDLAHNLGLRVVAEGIESEQQLATLRELGCDLGQGFFVAEPLPIEQLTLWFDQAPWKPSLASAEVARATSDRGRPGEGRDRGRLVLVE
jgi:EAL domain-containing protein (putative c-di-GMP-specific phosphodiesterase class I)